MQILDDEFTLPDHFTEGNPLSGKSLQFLQTVGNWGLFLSITGLVIATFTWLAFIAISRNLGTLVGGLGGGNPILYAIAPYYALISLMFGIAIMVHFAILVFHTRFAIRLRRSVRIYDQAMFEKSWKDMRNLMRIFGVLMAIGLLFVMFVIYLVLSMQSIPQLN